MSHTYGDKRIAAHLNEEGYHPRSSKHGSKQCQYFLADLAVESELFEEAAQAGEIVYQEDYTVGEGQDRWNTDLVIGPPSNDSVQVPVDSEVPIAEGEPEQIWLAIDAKSVMTEHGKARRNRQRDINSFADIMHSHHPGAVTGGIILINTADRFRSPLREEGDITKHDRIDQLVQGTIEIFRTIERAQGDVSPNVDAVGCIVVDHTNIDDGEKTQLVTDPPAPQPGDIVYYHKFLSIIAETFEERWLIGDPPQIESPADTDDLSVALDHAVIELAYYTKSLGDEIEEEVTEETVERIEEQLGTIEGLIDEIHRRHGE